MWFWRFKRPKWRKISEKPIFWKSSYNLYRTLEIQIVECECEICYNRCQNICGRPFRSKIVSKIIFFEKSSYSLYRTLEKQIVEYESEICSKRCQNIYRRTFQSKISSKNHFLKNLPIDSTGLWRKKSRKTNIVVAFLDI